MGKGGRIFGAFSTILLVALAVLWVPFFPKMQYILAVSAVAGVVALSFGRKWAHFPAIVLSSAVFFSFAGGFLPGPPFFADWPLAYGKIGKFASGFSSCDISAVDLRISPPSGILEGAEPLHFGLSAIFASGNAESPGVFPQILVRLAIFIAFLALPAAIYVASGRGGPGFVSAIIASVLGPSIYFLNGNVGLHLAVALGVVALRTGGSDLNRSARQLACFALMLFLHKGVFLSAAAIFSLDSFFSGKFRKRALVIGAIVLIGAFALALELSSHSYWEGYSSFKGGDAGAISERIASRQAHLSDYFANFSWIFLMAYLPIFSLGAAGLLSSFEKEGGLGNQKGLVIASAVLVSLSALAGQINFPWMETARLFLGYSSIPLVLSLLASFSGEIVRSKASFAAVLAVFVFSGAAYFQGFSDADSYGGVYSYQFSSTHGTGKFFPPMSGSSKSEALEVPFWISENYPPGDGGAEPPRFFFSSHGQFGGGFSLYMAPLLADRNSFSGYGYFSPKGFYPSDRDLKKECSRIVVSDMPCEGGIVLKEEGGIAFCDKGLSCETPCSFSFPGNRSLLAKCPEGRMRLPYSYVRGIVFYSEGEGAEVSDAREGEAPGYYADFGKEQVSEFRARDSRALPAAILAVGVLILLAAPFFLLY